MTDSEEEEEEKKDEKEGMRVFLQFTVLGFGCVRVFISD